MSKKRQAESTDCGRRDSDSVPPVSGSSSAPLIQSPLPTRRGTPVLAPAGQADGVGGGKQQDGVGGGGKGSCKQQEDGDTVLLAAQTPRRKRWCRNTFARELKLSASQSSSDSQSHSSQPSGSSLQSQPHSQPPGTEVADSAPAAFAAFFAARFALQIANDEVWG